MIVEDDLYTTSSFGPKLTFKVDIDGIFLHLLKRNPENRMAFEYLMAIRLCNRDVQGVIELFPFLDGLAYPETPPLYEQAAIDLPLQAPRRGDGRRFRAVFSRSQDERADHESVWPSPGDFRENRTTQREGRGSRGPRDGQVLLLLFLLRTEETA